MNSRMKVLVITGMIWGAFMLIDSLLYAFAGFGFWAPEPPCGQTFCHNTGREMTLFIIHIVSILLGVASTIFWANERERR